MSVAWIARIPFADGKRAEGSTVMADALPRLRALPGVEEVWFHNDSNDPNVVWAYWRLASRDDVFAVHDSQEFLSMAKGNLALYASRPEDFFLEDDASFGA